MPAPEAVRIRPAVLWLAACGALSSGAALLVAIVTGAPLWLASTFVFVPGLVAVGAASVIARREQQDLFIGRVRVGVVAGVIATAAYDIVRWSVEAAGLTSTRSFIALPIFGAGLTGLPPEHAIARTAGWAFHITNGIGFALAYVLIAAGRPAVLGIAFALALEGFMVAMYPGWLGVDLTAEFLSVSVLGHVAYGAVIGVAGKRCR